MKLKNLLNIMNVTPRAKRRIDNRRSSTEYSIKIYMEGWGNPLMADVTGIRFEDGEMVIDVQGCGVDFDDNKGA